MKLFIAEKPSLARAIVDVLPKPHKKNDGYIETGNGDVVTWCIGHLLEQAPPEDYDVKYIARACSVISTFGSSITECLYLKKPVISVAHSIENAHGSYELSRKSPACFDLGYFKDLDRERLIHAINTYQEPSKEIMDWLNESPIDGKGAERVKQWLIEKAT